jgi:hypothetical protein
MMETAGPSTALRFGREDKGATNGRPPHLAKNERDMGHPGSWLGYRMGFITLRESLSVFQINCHPDRSVAQWRDLLFLSDDTSRLTRICITVNVCFKRRVCMLWL